MGGRQRPIASLQLVRAILPKFAESELDMTATMAAMSLSVGSLSSMLARLVFLLVVSTACLQRCAQPLVVYCCVTMLAGLNAVSMGVWVNGPAMLLVLVASGAAFIGTMLSVLGGAM